MDVEKVDKTKRAVARGRLRMLFNAVVNGRVTTNKHSLRHPPFGFFSETVEDRLDHDEDYDLVSYELIPKQLSHVKVTLRQRTNKIRHEELMGFDNTGNICVWPAEEVLGYYLWKNKELVENKTICELGAGIGLAGFIISYLKCKSILLTDGNQVAAENLNFNAKSIKQAKGCQCVDIRGCKLLWDATESITDTKVQVVIGADILWRIEFHLDLLHVLREILCPDGIVYLIVPSRRGSMKAFVDEAKKQKWKIQVRRDFDEDVRKAEAKVSAIHATDQFIQFNTDLHGLYLLILQL